MVWNGEGWAPPYDIAQDTPHENDNHNSIHTGSVNTRNKDRAFHCWKSGWGEKYASDAPKPFRARNNTTTGTSNVRALSGAGKVEELTHEMKRYRWNILGLCEVRWKIFGETSTTEDHKLFFSSHDDRHEHGVRFSIYKDTLNAIMGCRPVSSRLITICLKALPFNITIIQAYAPTDFDDDDIEDFYDQLQEALDHTSKKDVLVVQGD